jgi:hypothetical protein
VLEHCSKGETNCWFSIFQAFPSDRIPKATKDVNRHSLIQIFAFRNELKTANVLAVKKYFQHNLSFTPIEFKFFASR